MRTQSLLSTCRSAGALLLLAAASGGAQTIQYGYDQDSRLISASYSTGNTLQYVFDPAGDLLQFISANPVPSLASLVDRALPSHAAPFFKAVSLNRVSKNGISVSFSWSAVAGQHYRLQATEDLNSPWQDVPGDIIALGPIAETEFSDASGSKQRFFRVLLLP